MTPADELRAAVARLNNTRNCDNHTIDSDSRELLDLIRVLLRTREPVAKWLASWDGADFDEHASMPDDLAHALTIARAINAAAAPGPVLGGTIADRLLGGDPR